MEPHLIETMAFSQRLSVRMFLSQSHLHEPFVRNACIFPPLLQNLYDVLFLSRKNGGGGVLVVSIVMTGLQNQLKSPQKDTRTQNTAKVSLFNSFSSL